MEESKRIEEYRIGNYVINAKSGSIGMVVTIYLSLIHI